MAVADVQFSFREKSMKSDIGVGVCTLVVRGRKLLVAERIGKRGNGFLAVPGGVQDKGESWLKTGLRELGEEAGNDIKVIIRTKDKVACGSESDVPLFVTNNVLSNGSHWVTVWLRAEWQWGEAVNAEPEKKKDWVWMSVEEIMDDPRMAEGKKAWLASEFHDALHWFPLPEITKFRDILGV